MRKRFTRKVRRTQPNTYAFIDTQNLNLGIQKAGWKMDWRKFRKYLETEYGVTKAYMFIGYMPENVNMYEQMHEAGYAVVLKPTVDMNIIESETSDKERPATKGNVDADLVLFAMKEIPNYKNAIIVSGDGDFFGLIEYLEQNNKLLHVMTPNWQYSSLLKPFDNYIIRIDQLRRELSYHDRRKTKSR